ncbi:MAG: AGE family epimerase/isomerase [Parvibaculaceae bacterium]|nr:AGE family epimerase/isomerase [Parvibaculaceae bacterium]
MIALDQTNLSEDALRTWLSQSFLPFWAEHSFDVSCGGFHDRLNLDFDVMPVGYKRLRVQARQIFVFSHAHQLGLFPSGLELAQRGVAFCLEHGWASDKGGWVFKVSPDGRQVIDGTRDLYCQAFMIFALASYYEASGDEAVLEWIERTVVFIEEYMQDYVHGGYQNLFPVVADDPQSFPRLQNPHMHLTEALLVAARATGKPAYLDRAGELVELFFTKFLKVDKGACGVVEYFDKTLSPLKGEAGVRSEPGHLFEWVWIVQLYRKLTGEEEFASALQQVLDEGLLRGMDDRPDYLAASFDEVSLMGEVLKSAKRLWPQTEALKSLCAAVEGTKGAQKADYRVRAQRQLGMMIGAYRKGLTAPVFHEHLDEQGKVLTNYYPVSSLYHLFLSFSEYLRVIPED